MGREVVRSATTRAGFTEIIGVDIHLQPNYPFTFGIVYVTQ